MGPAQEGYGSAFSSIRGGGVSNMWLDGLVAGTAGAIAMTLTEKVEQRFTGRPDSYVPAVTLGRLVGVPDERSERSRALNLAMHLGQGAVLGIVRSIMAEGGLRGLRASQLFTSVRFANDQTLENYTGSGAPPWTWPRKELAIDMSHKIVYGVVTGLVADRLAARRGPGAGAGHASLRPGRHEGVGPPPER
jgi:hypothetical protein